MMVGFHSETQTNKFYAYEILKHISSILSIYWQDCKSRTVWIGFTLSEEIRKQFSQFRFFVHNLMKQKLIAYKNCNKRKCNKKYTMYSCNRRIKRYSFAIFYIFHIAIITLYYYVDRNLNMRRRQFIQKTKFLIWPRIK